jgi:hypothetical protein
MRRSLILAHRYLGIVLSVLFVIWFASAIPMIYTGGMPRVDAVERLQHLPPIDLARVRLTPSDAGAKAGLGPGAGRATLLMIMDRPAYRFSGRGGLTVFADTGELLEDVTRRDALGIAARFTGAPVSSLIYLREMEQADQWTIGQRNQLPLHKIAVEDGAGTEVYVSEATAEVAMRTTRETRALAWGAAIPHWFYLTPLRLNNRLWNRVVIWTSGAGVFAALLGVVLGVTQYRVRYTGIMRWHYLTGIVFGVLAVTWVFSGFLSMEPFEWFSQTRGESRIPQALSGGPLDLSAFPAFDVGEWRRISGGRAIKEIAFRRIQDDPYYLVTLDEANAPVVVHATPLERRGEPFSMASIVDRVQRGYPGAAIAESSLLMAADAYYYDRGRELHLPVVRIKFADADGTWVYVDGTSQLVARFTRRQRIERWLYHGLHSLDFPYFYDKRPLWDIVVIVLLAGGTTLSAIGVWIGVRRVIRTLHV